MTPFTIRPWLFCLVGVLLGAPAIGCGSSSGPVVGRDIEKRVYLVGDQEVGQPPEIVGGYDRVERLKTYPSSAKKDEAWGVIWMQCTVSASGVATRIRLAEGGHPALETAALDVVQRLEFRPASMGGAPVQAKIQIPVIFQGPYAKPEES